MIDKEVKEFLEHFGVKGMKWGVRKERLGSRDISLRRGKKVFNISSRTSRTLRWPVYTAHKPRDILNYRSTYASQQTYDNVPVFSNAFVVTKKVKAAGSNAQLTAFKKLWDEDRNGVARALADTQKDMKFAAAFNARILKLKRDNIYHKRIMNKGEHWVKTKGLREFNASLAISQRVLNTNKSSVDRRRKLNTTVRQKYFKELEKRGYNAVVDLNDIRNYGSEEPLLIFRANKVLKRATKPVKMTEKDISKAADAYLSNKKLKEYRDTLHNTEAFDEE